MLITEPTKTSGLNSDDAESLPGTGQLLRIDPSQYAEWDHLLSCHPKSSFFHTSAWAKVLKATYGHVPSYFCRFSNGRLQDLLPTVEVARRLTGRRGVSLAFTDVCEPLRSSSEAGGPLYQEAMAHGHQRGWRFLECRGNNHDRPGCSPSLVFYRHVIGLGGNKGKQFDHLDSAVRRAVRKAQKSSVTIEFGNDPESIQAFYRLHCVTRRRHGVPPQPFRFFENILRYVVLPGHGFVALARCGKEIVAGGVFFHHLKQSYYKFGASDSRFQHLRPNDLLMWDVISRYGTEGYEALDLGRTSLANQGLRRFKLGFGAREYSIEYFKYDFRKQSFVRDVDRAQSWANPLLRRLPLSWLRLIGQVVYPHLS